MSWYKWKLGRIAYSNFNFTRGMPLIDGQDRWLCIGFKICIMTGKERYRDVGPYL